MNTWRPDCFESERMNTFMHEALSLSVSASGMPGSFLENPPVPYRENGAVFVINRTAVLLRFDWGIWYYMDTSSELEIIELTRQNRLLLYLYGDGTRRSCRLPIYEIDSLPEGMFTAEELEKLPLRSGLCPLPDTRSRENGEAGDDEDEELDMGETEPDVCPEEPPEKLLSEAERQKRLTACRLMTEQFLEPLHPKFLHLAEGDTYSFIFYEVKGRILHLTVCNLAGCWLTDETPFHEDVEPLWFTENDHTVSPVYFAGKFDAYLRERFSCDVISAIILPKEFEHLCPDTVIPTWKPITAVSFEEAKPYGPIVPSAAYFRDLTRDLETAPEPRLNLPDIEAAVKAHKIYPQII